MWGGEGDGGSTEYVEKERKWAGVKRSLVVTRPTMVDVERVRRAFEEWMGLCRRSIRMYRGSDG